jgi:HD superfamily phosphohydrolase
VIATHLPANLKKGKIHEVVTGHIIQTDRDLVRTLGPEKCERIAQLLAKGVGDPILRSIVSGPLDADEQDYLLRDSKFAGVNYGIFDIGQLHRSLTTEALDEQKELHAVEQFVMAKYYLTNMVYRHKVRLIKDQCFSERLASSLRDDSRTDLIWYV